MIDNHMRRWGQTPHEAKEAYFASYNQSSGEAFHGIQARYHTAMERLLLLALFILGPSALVAFCVWAMQHNLAHLS